MVSAAASPLVMLVAAIAAGALATAGYNPIRQTISVLAAAGRSEWVMSTGIALSAGCLVLVGLGLFTIRPLARVALATGGACGAAVAVLPVTMVTTLHLTVTFVSALLLALWPALAISKAETAPAGVKLPFVVAGSVILFGLLAWTAYETQGGALLGLAERVTAIAELGWPAVVVATARFRKLPLRTPSIEPLPQPEKVGQVAVG